MKRLASRHPHSNLEEPGLELRFLDLRSRAPSFSSQLVATVPCTFETREESDEMQAAYRWRKGGGARIDLIDGLQCPECSRPEGFYLLNEYTDRHAGSSRDVSPTVRKGPPGRDDM